jgi:tryptophan 2,3-dioxygenase
MTPDTHRAIEGMLALAQQLARVKHTETARAADTRARLNAHGIDDESIAQQLSTLKWNTAENETAVISTYSYLHGLQHLDDIQARSHPLTHPASATLALFRAAEICLHTIGVLSERMLADLQANRLSAALSHARWRAGLQQLLYKISLLVVETRSGAVGETSLNIQDSRIFKEYRAAGHRLQDWLRHAWPENDADVFGKDIDDPKRFIYFNEFVNVGDERMWGALLARVPLADTPRLDDETGDAFYARVVGSDDIQRMASAMETAVETDLLPFRIIHQITEVVASVVNAHVCDAVEEVLMAPADDLHDVQRGLVLGNRLLSVVDDAIRLMMRTLTPHAYSQVRPNLGMVRGTSSMVLRRTLFNSSYPLLVRAVKLRLMDLDGPAAAQDEAVQTQARRVLEGAAAGSPLAGILQQLVILHQHVRTWRDNHVQLPKTHLGVSADVDNPTVSLSGDDSAVDIAHGLRRTHGADPIAPIYRALMGEPPPALHEMLTPGGFDEHVAHSTARAVLGVYAEVQERFQKRCPMKHLLHESE